MSKLDLVTTVIIGLCVLAIGFLIYKFGFENKTNTSPATDRSSIENALREVTESDEDTYTPAENETATENIDANNSAAKSEMGDEATRVNERPSATTSAANTTTTTTSGPPRTIVGSGQYMIMGNSYRQVINAEQEVRDLKKKGYTNAAYHLFNTGAYATVVIDRFDSPGKAERIAEEVNAATGINAYVQKLRLTN